MSKFIVYKISGGLNHMLIQISNAVQISKICNRKLIIDCYSGAFKNDFNKYFNIDNTEYYTDYSLLIEKGFFDELEASRIMNSEIKYNNGEYFLDDTKISFTKQEVLSNSQDLIFFTCIYPNFEEQDSIKVKSWVLDEIKKKDKVEDYIGLHYRNTDMKHDLNVLVGKLKDQKLKRIYLSTDDFHGLENLKRILGDEYEIIQYTKPIDNNGKNIHYGNLNKDEVIMNALIDMYFLTKSNVFIPSEKSSLSKKILRLRKNDTFFS